MKVGHRMVMAVLVAQVLLASVVREQIIFQYLGLATIEALNFLKLDKLDH